MPAVWNTRDLPLAVGCKRQKVNWDQKLRGRNRLTQGKADPLLPWVCGEKLGSPAWWAEQRQCFFHGRGCGGVIANCCVRETHSVPSGMLFLGGGVVPRILYTAP